ncbi:MAG: hypothetical protein C0605_02575 [Hyphomicrobiales bacterium]|nr:MAG: hypothetical protein C0605_02575 [Hyphomicrobiales bacterium]
MRIPVPGFSAILAVSGAALAGVLIVTSFFLSGAAMAGGGGGGGIFDNIRRQQEVTRERLARQRAKRPRKVKRIRRARPRRRPVYTPPPPRYTPPAYSPPIPTPYATPPGVAGGSVPLAPPPGMVPPPAMPSLPPVIANNPYINPPAPPRGDRFNSSIGPASGKFVPIQPLPQGPVSYVPGVGAPPSTDPGMATELLGHFFNSDAAKKVSSTGDLFTAATLAIEGSNMASARNAEEYSTAVNKYARASAQSAGALQGAGTGGALAVQMGAPQLAPVTSLIGSVIGGYGAGKAYDATMSAGVKQMARDHYAKNLQ